MISIAPEAFVWSRVGFGPPDVGKRPLVACDSAVTWGFSHYIPQSARRIGELLGNSGVFSSLRSSAVGTCGLHLGLD